MNTREWYEMLHKPSWAPQPEVFGRVWSVIYPIIFAVNISVFILWQKGKISWVVALPFLINLVCNLAYTPIQFGFKNQLVSTFVIFIVLATIVWSMIAIYPYSKWIVLAYVPYLLWVGIATVLQSSLWWLNR